MRQYRAKTVRDGEWVYGLLLRSESKSFIVVSFETDADYGDESSLYATEWYEVVPETVCQFTGTYDKNETKIYELDIIQSPHGTTYAVKFHNGMFEPVAYYVTGLFEIVGNLIDNRGDYLG